MPSVPKKFGSQVDLQKIPLLGIVPESGATAPTSPIEGQLWVDTTLTPDRLKVYEGATNSWVLVSQTGVELLVNKAAASGYASLDGTTKVPIAQVPTGTTGTTVPFGNDARFSDSRAPSGTATGDLTGTYPAPTVAALAITDAKVATANKDGVAGTPSMRTLGTGAQTAMAGNTRLDQIIAPTTSVSLNSQKITNLLAPSAGTDAANKTYVDGIASGIDTKLSVRAASTSAVTVTYVATNGVSGRGQITAAPNTLDGVSLAANDRILLKDQAAGAQNGILVVTTVGTGANGVWDRADDFDSDTEVTAGAYTFVEEGSNADSGWVLTTNNPIIIGGASGTALAFTQFSGAGQITAGAGLTKTGNSVDVIGTTNRIVVNADSVDIASGYVGQTSITTLGTIATGVWTATDIAIADGGTGASTAAAARTNLGTISRYAADLGALSAGVETLITHSLGSVDVHAMFSRVSDGYDEMLSWRKVSTTQIGVTADIAYGAAALRVVVMG